MQLCSSLLLPAALLIAASFLFASEAQGAPMSSQSNYYNELETDPDPEAFLEMLARLGQSIVRARENVNSKRGMDLGLSRGYSGSMAAKHLMGLASANYAAGPGRRRRSVSLE